MEFRYISTELQHHVEKEDGTPFENIWMGKHKYILDKEYHDNRKKAVEIDKILDQLRTFLESVPKQVIYWDHYRVTIESDIYSRKEEL